MINTQRIYDYLDTLKDKLAEDMHIFVRKHGDNIELIFSDCDHTYNLAVLAWSGEVTTISGTVTENFAECVEEIYRLTHDGADVMSADDAPVEICAEVLLQLAAIAVHDKYETYEYLNKFVNINAVKSLFVEKKEYITVLGEKIEI